MNNRDNIFDFMVTSKDKSEIETSVKLLKEYLERRAGGIWTAHIKNHYGWSFWCTHKNIEVRPSKTNGQNKFICVIDRKRNSKSFANFPEIAVQRAIECYREQFVKCENKALLYDNIQDLVLE